MPVSILVALVLGVLCHFAFYYFEDYGKTTTWQFFQHYDYFRVAYWCVIILCVFDIARSLYIYCGIYEDSARALSRLLIRSSMELGTITACLRRLRQ